MPAPRSRADRRVTAIVCLAIVSGCAGQESASAPPSEVESAGNSSQAGPPSPSAAAAKDIFGEWHRAQSCQEMLAAFESAGLAESHRGWLQGNFFGGEPGPETGDPCAGAAGPLEHSHSFTTSFEFGSGDENGEDVDGGDFAIVDEDTLSFPSHAREFRYDGEILVGYVIDGADVVTFSITMPQPCTDACAEAYAWAHSAFASGPWERGEVP